MPKTANLWPNRHRFVRILSADRGMLESAEEFPEEKCLLRHIIKGDQINDRAVRR